MIFENKILKTLDESITVINSKYFLNFQSINQYSL